VKEIEFNAPTVEGPWGIPFVPCLPAVSFLWLIPGGVFALSPLPSQARGWGFPQG
jgi:hypothetical protein